MNKIKFDEIFEGKITGYDNICPEAYSGCSGARNKSKFESECISSMSRYIEKGTCGDTYNSLAPILIRGDLK